MDILIDNVEVRDKDESVKQGDIYRVYDGLGYLYLQVAVVGCQSLTPLYNLYKLNKAGFYYSEPMTKEILTKRIEENTMSKDVTAWLKVKEARIAIEGYVEEEK